MSIHIITHCWAGQLRQYATMLRCQLASLANHPPECDVQISVCYSSTDTWTVDVINDSLSWFPSNVILNPIDLPTSHLFRRAIGRNIGAKQNTSDVVWFTDCDYLFGDGCLDALEIQSTALNPLNYPRTVYIHKSHAIGDDYIERVNAEPRDIRPDIHPADFNPMKNIRSIGGVMIVTAEIASRGYCMQSRRMLRPVSNKGWRRSHCDRSARMHWGVGKGKRIQLPEVYRLRHSKISYKKRSKPASHD